jgi:hypothetical protein
VSLDRRDFLKLVSVSIGGKLVWLTPGEAYSQNIEHKVLSESEIHIIESISEGLVPGSRDAGVSHFIDHHLSLPAEDCLLMIRYLGVHAPYVDFYRACLSAAESHAQNTYDKKFSELNNDEIQSIVDGIASGSVENWQGPPAAFFYFVLRADGVDVTYGTEAAFANLEFPYMAHIEPPGRW